MFDYHMHSTVSFDGHDTALDMARAAARNGLKEICFTDHIDHGELPGFGEMVFDPAAYSRAYDGLEVPGLKIRRGMEFGISPDNPGQLRQDLNLRPFDFVIGSVHFVDGEDVYLPPYWQGRSVDEAYRAYLEETLRSVRAHTDYDVLGHLTYICKCRGNPEKRLLPYSLHRELADEILRELVRRGKGLELNTSGMDRCGGFLPTAEYFRRFRELGGEIVTVGSDAHDARRVGQYAGEACALLKDIFGYVCTFEARKPIFHKL